MGTESRRDDTKSNRPESSLRVSDGMGKNVQLKKIGAESSDPNRHSQPRLPGSVVGEASMRPPQNSDKITKVRAPRERQPSASCSTKTGDLTQQLEASR